MKLLYDNLTDKNGKLHIGGIAVSELAEKYGTPLMVTDVDRFEENCKRYTDAIATYFDGRARACYASKALCAKALYPIIAKLGLGADAVSLGELKFMRAAAFPMDRVCFHGNAKTDVALTYAVENEVGHVVVDNFEELQALNAIAKAHGKIQAVLLRISPGIDPHTFEAVKTGRVDSKFGVAIATGQAMEFVKKAIAAENLRLDGLHCHIGSQIFESKPFEDAATVMMNFIGEIYSTTGYQIDVLDIGGGIGVRYLESDPFVYVPEVLKNTAHALKKAADKNGVKVPFIYFEPGRSLIADTTLTVYTVQSFKQITGYKNYVAIDGGMPDNPRYALYRSSYTCLAADKLDQKCDLICTVAGCCCESGDLIQEDVALPQMQRGELLAVLTTGAYNYAMSSNYNMIPRPAVVAVKGGKDAVLVERESIEGILTLQKDLNFDPNDK